MSSASSPALSWILSSDPAHLQLDVVYPWLHGCYWSQGIRRDVVERAFANSLVLGAYEAPLPGSVAPADSSGAPAAAVAHGAQLGVARLVSDFATFAWLCDVFVDERARGQGLARAMVAALLADPRLQTLRRWALATRDAHAVYAPLGFGPVNALHWMERLPDPAGWRTPAIDGMLRP